MVFDNPMTELVNRLNEYHREHPQQRLGQAYFNGLYAEEPGLADMFRATEVDPFHDDEKVGAFLNAVAPYYE